MPRRLKSRVLTPELWQGRPVFLLPYAPSNRPLSASSGALGLYSVRCGQIKMDRRRWLIFFLPSAANNRRILQHHASEGHHSLYPRIPLPQSRALAAGSSCARSRITAWDFASLFCASAKASSAAAANPSEALIQRLSIREILDPRLLHCPTACSLAGSFPF